MPKPLQVRGLLPRVGLVAVLAVAALQVATPLIGFRGAVRDAETGSPLAGVVARVGNRVAQTGPGGWFQLGLVPPWQTAIFEAEGYEPRTAQTWLPIPVDVQLPPVAIEVRTLDDDTGRLVGGQVEGDALRVEPIDGGRFRLQPARPGSVVSARAEGYLPGEAVYRGGALLEIRLTPTRIGRVVNAADGRPIAGALVLSDEQLYVSGPAGEFQLPARPRRPLRVTAPGYRRLEVDADSLAGFELRLEPFAVRGVYLTYYAVGDEGLRSNALRLLETTEANAIVMDVKGDRGLLSYPSRVALAEQIGANASPTLPKVERFVADLHARGKYAIARIVLFKDDLLARNGGRAGLDPAIKDGRSGQPWVDGEGLAWVDPFLPEVWEYNLALAREAAELGFDEVQFDYVRFPTDPASGSSVEGATYSRESTPQSRVEAITSFLAQAHQTLRPYGVFLGVDLFGYACWRDDDLGIGQLVASVAPHVDYLSPMVYPSTFAAGLPGSLTYPGIVSRPYDVVYASLRQARARANGQAAVLRPWLQYFDDYAWATGRAYNSGEILAQRRAAAEAGAVGWMFWDPTNRYNRGGLGR